MSSQAELECFDDPKYRSFAAQVEKALKNFEYSAEWADLISALVKLNKVLQANSSYKILPKRVTIGKRLAQCLHPALPGGVHLKALDVYDTIFKIIGQERLQMDLCIYSAGIFSLLANASMQVRPVLLNVYETHLLPLGENLRTSLDGLLLGLLPGLEEGSEHFDRINLMLDKISRSVGLQYFYSSMWRCVLCSPSSSIVRLAAMQLILRQFDKRKMTDDQLYLIGLDIDTMVQAVCEALQDENVLTQRATLDVLLLCFPLSSLPVSRFDAQTILSSAIFVLLRRDMSLNRRLYSWILGVDLNKRSSSGKGVKKSVVQYFEQNSSVILTDALFDMMEKLSDSFSNLCCGVTLQSVIGIEAKFFRILISLLDKAEIGPVIINGIFVGVLRLIEKISRAYDSALLQEGGLCCKKCTSTSNAKDGCSKGHSEFVKSVNLFVGSFESDFVWRFVAEKFGDACSRAADTASEALSKNAERQNFEFAELCGVIETLLHVLSIETYVDIQTVLLPELLDKIFIALKETSHHLSGEHLVTGLHLCSEVMKHIQPFQPGGGKTGTEQKHTVSTCIESFKEFFVQFLTLTILKEKDSVSLFMDDFQKKSARDVYPSGHELLLQYCEEAKPYQVQFESYDKDNDSMLRAFKDACKVLVDICCFPVLNRKSTLDVVAVKSDGLPEWVTCLVACACCCEYEEDELFPNSQSDVTYFSEICLTAAATILELMALTASNHQDNVVSDGTEAVVVSVIVPPPLSIAHLAWLHAETSFYERVCSILWRELDSNDAVPNLSVRHQTCSRLLFLLHQLCPDEMVERLLLQDILAVEEEARVVAVEKFTRLWHYIRDGGQNFGPGSVTHNKAFSRCLFAVMDQLVVERYSLFPDLTAANTKGQAIVSTCVSNWLRHVLEEGDLCRVLEPYILISLHAGTHRKSLQSMLQFNRDFGDYEKNHDDYSLFLKKQNRDIYLECEECLEVQREADDSSFANYQDLSVDSVLTYALCEVHQQLAKERHRYEHLVALLTLSDELESEGGLKSPHLENDLNRWAKAFVEKVISKGIDMYKRELVNAENALSDLSEENGVSTLHNVGIEAAERNYSSADSEVSQATEAIELNLSFDKNQNPLYQHILIYQEQFDANRVLYSLQGVLTIASAHPSVFIHAACTTSLASNDGPYSNLIQELLVRHERTIEQGRSFYEPTSPSLKGAMRNRMLVEVLISVCLYYMRSGFPAYRKISGLSAEMNHEVQCMATQLLSFIVKELTLLAQQEATLPAASQAGKFPSSTKQLSAYIVLVLQRHQVQSSVLTCLLTTIYAVKDPEKESSMQSVAVTETSTTSEISDVELCRDDQVIKRYLGGSIQQASTLFSHFLSLAFDLIKLEHFAFPVRPKAQASQPATQPGPSIILNRRERSKMKPKVKRSLRLISHLLSLAYQYDSDSPIAAQKVFVSSLLEIYKLENSLELHLQCSTHLISNLSYLGSALPSIVTPVILHMCLNLEGVNKGLINGTAGPRPPSYIESTIKSIASLVHWCLLNESSSKSVERSLESAQADSVSVSASKVSQSTTGSIGSGLSTLLSVFNTSSSAKSNNTTNESERSDGLAAAKVAVLNNLALIVSCTCTLWRDMVTQNDLSVLSAEETKSVSYHILQFLGPLAIQYGEYLLVAFALVWQSRGVVEDGKKQEPQMPNSLLKCTKDHENLTDLLLAMRLLSVEMFFSLVKQIVKDPPPVTNEPKGTSLQESVLQMLLNYMRRQKSMTLSENWPGFLAILQETLVLAQNAQTTTGSDGPISPNCYFLLLYLLTEYVKRTTPFTQKKDQRELQDIAGKCIEACNLIAGSSLEQGTWIRRNVSVLPGPQVPEGAMKVHRKTESQSSIDLTDGQLTVGVPQEGAVHTSSSDTLVSSMPHKVTSETDHSPRAESAKERPTSFPPVQNAVLNTDKFRNSVRALTVLSEVVANLLDVIYGSEDKEKVVPVLASIMMNVTPYLRNHSSDNIPSFCACVSFLSSISGFQHTRRAWRKDVIDLFLDTPFFHMPAECIEGWMSIIDNLMTHDKLTFKEIMSRTSLSRTGPTTPTLNIFSNKEQELELRALHVKRLAFIVFSSEKDQYQKQLPEIQERLAECLRFPNVPGIQNRVFLCFRILILRVSPHSLTSLWPTMYTELVHVMLLLEQALDTTFSDESSKIAPKNKTQNGRSPSPTATRTVMNCWPDMYLSACKVLDLALCLPVHYVPQFQLYRWSFVGEAPAENSSPTLETPRFHQNGPAEEKDAEEEAPEPKFVPHCVRIQRLFATLHPERADKVLPIIPGKPLLNIARLKNVDQLQLFFNTITSPTHLLMSQTSTKNSKRKVNSETVERMALVEKALHKDFIRPML